MAGTYIKRDSDGKTIYLEYQEAEQADTTARAKRVTLVDSSGNALKFTQAEENRIGSECSGSEGATGRILTLQNTSTSGGPVSVWVGVTIIAQADMTISHLSASSTITFDNINIYNSDTIRVLYYV